MSGYVIPCQGTSRRGTCPCLIPLQPLHNLPIQLRWCPLLSPATQIQSEQGGCFLHLDYKVIKTQTCCVQSGRNPGAASLRFVAHAKGWGERRKGWGRASFLHTWSRILYNAPLNPTFVKHLGNTPESNEYSSLARATGLHPHTFNWAP